MSGPKRTAKSKLQTPAFSIANIAELLLCLFMQAHEEAKLTTYPGAVVLLLGLAITIAVAVYSLVKKGREDGYEPVLA